MEKQKYTLDFLAFCKKTEQYVAYYKRQIKSYNDTAHNILKSETDLILPQLIRKQKCGIITTFISSFIGLAYEGISSFLHRKRHKAVKALDSKTTIQHNKLMQLENSMVMYEIYNAETLEQLINTVHHIHITTLSNAKLFADYGLVIKRLHPYYDMKLVTFGTDDNKNLIVQFPVAIQPYMQQPLILYQIETVPVPIVDKNT